MLRSDATLRGGHPEPERSFGLYLGDTMTCEVPDTEAVLSKGVTLLGGALKPAYRLGVVFGNATSNFVGAPEEVLRFSVTLCGGLAHFIHGRKRKKQALESGKRALNVKDRLCGRLGFLAFIGRTARAGERKEGQAEREA